MRCNNSEKIGTTLKARKFFLFDKIYYFCGRPVYYL